MNISKRSTDKSQPIHGKKRVEKYKYLEAQVWNGSFQSEPEYK